ncbi:MAG: FapA family protein [Bacillota bacterium]
MDKKLKIKAENLEKAKRKAKAEYQKKFSRKVSLDDVKLELKETRKRFFGLGKTIKIYQSKLINEDNKKNVAEEITDNIDLDGDFKLKVTEEGIKVKILPPEGQGEPVQYQYIKQKLDEKEIVEIDWQTLQEEVNNPSEEWVIIAPRKPELDRDFEVHVYLDDDELNAYLDYHPALGGEKLTVNKLYDILEENNIRYGIKTDKLKQIINNRIPEEKIKVAEGDPPEPGKDAELIYHFEKKENSIGTRRDDGSIDFFDLGLINNVTPGDKLVTLKKSEPGTPGKKVTGKEISPPVPEKKKLPAGKNVEKKDETILVSKISGQVVKEGKKVNVLPVHEVRGNVDLSTGNIDFNGNVKVRGDVKEGFEVIAEGNIEIKGNVSAARIISKTGKVIIHKGFVGKDKGKVEAKGEVKVKFVENASINSQEDIIVTDAVMHSTLIAANKIIVEKNKGLIVGGKCRAGQEIKANVFGSNFATETVLEAGINPEIKSRLQELEKELERIRKNLMKSEQAIKLLQEKKKELGRLPADKEEAYQQVKNTKIRLKEKIQEYEREQEELHQKISRMNRGRITVKDKIYPGVQLHIGKSFLNIQNEMKSSIFVEEDGEIRKRGL